jgi:hypothetical protein
MIEGVMTKNDPKKRLYRDVVELFLAVHLRVLLCLHQVYLKG